jgi:hypothetical protein
MSFVKSCITGIGIFILLANAELRAQAEGDYWEVGIFGGVSQYYGDLTHSWFEPDEAHPAIGAILRYSPNKYLSIRGGIYFATISGNDIHGNVGHQRRNLHFESNITEASAVLEWNIMGLNLRRANRDNFSPYLFAGIGVFRFNPMAEMGDEWIPLQPHNTEGQGLEDYPGREPYSLTQAAIPMGIGAKYQLTREVVIGVEVAWRKTFTDYLDDVSTTHVDKDLLRDRVGERAVRLSDRSAESPFSDEPLYSDGDQRGNADTDDWYTFFGVTITYKPRPPGCPMQ